jgi:putative SOS response-associated peptidase YedK
MEDIKMFPKFRLASTVEELARWAKVPLSEIPRVAITDEDRPPSVHPVLRICADTGKRVVSAMRLGLIPSYAHDDHHAMEMTEAHAECMTTTAGLRLPFKRRRCLIPANAFHEFRNFAGDALPPSSFSLDSGMIFSIGGVWECWSDDNGKTIESFATITVHPDPALRSFFDRMPVLIDESAQNRWLAPGEFPLDLLKPLSPAELKTWKMMPYQTTSSLSAVEAF